VIELDPKGNVTDLKWLPNGNLLIFGDFGSEVLTGSPYRWELRQWDSRNWAEVEGFRYHVGNQANGLLEVDPSGSRVMISGLVDSWFSLDESGRPTRIPFPSHFGGQLCPNQDKFLGVRHMRMGDPSCFVEVEYDPERIESRSRLIQFFVEDYQIFFYGPTGKTIFVKRSGVPYLDEFETRLPSPLVSTQQRPHYDAQLIRVRRYGAPARRVDQFWIAADWGSVVFEFEEVYRGDSEKRRFGFFHFENSTEVSMLEGLTEMKEITSLAIHPSQRFLAITREKTSVVAIYDIETQTIIRNFDWGIEPINNIDFSRDGTMIAAIAGGNKIIVWDVDF